MTPATCDPEALLELERRFPLDGLEHSMGCSTYPDACNLCQARVRRARTLRQAAAELREMDAFTACDAVIELAAEWEALAEAGSPPPVQRQPDVEA